MATQVAALPDDALAGVFRGLPLRSLAVVRCVCKAWRDVVDARALLLPHLHLLPRTLRGVFLNYSDHPHPHHFVRPCSPSTIPRVDGTLRFLPHDGRRWVSVLDHCNGLLLCGKAGLSELCVCNPATRRWTVLPRWWERAADARCDPYAGAYIAFDPAESPQYEVILVPAVPPTPVDNRCWSWTGEAVHCWTAESVQRPDKDKDDAPFCLDWFFLLPDDGTAVGQWEFQQLQHEINDPCRYMECRGYMDWPPAPWTLRVFSSSTGQWEDRAFVREGLPAGTVADMRLDRELPDRLRWRYAVYHHGSLYVHCRGSFVTRLSLSKSKYQVIKMPVIVNKYTKPYLGKLQNGVCFGIIVHVDQLKIWLLNEACGQMEWVLKYETVVGHYPQYFASIASDYSGRRHYGSWSIEGNVKIQDSDYDGESLSQEQNIEILDTDYDDESPSEEENIEIQDTDYDDKSLSEEENIEIQETDYVDESLSEEKNIEIQETDHDAESLPEGENVQIQDTNHGVESLSKKGYEWDSDNDDTFTINTEIQGKYLGNDLQPDIIGFHPYKEVVFIVQRFQVLAYHLNSTKIQYLGNLHPKYYSIWDHIQESFPYTPCMIGDLLHGDQAGGPSSSPQD